MVTEYLSRLIKADKSGIPTVTKKGLYPVYFDDDTFDDASQYWGELIEICGKMWTVLGYSGLIIPWHESDPFRILDFQKNSLQKWYAELQKMDVSVSAYCVLGCTLSEYTQYERPALLLHNKKHMSWIRKLREHAGSSECLEDVVKFIWKFLELQVGRIGKAYIKPSALIKKDHSKKFYLDTYYRIVDRIKYLDSKGIDFIQWLEKKFDSCFSSFSDHRVYINTVVNVNSFDPDLTELFAEVGDPWNKMKRFLELPSDCEFPDGFIPKGWHIASDDPTELQNISKVMGDGFYYYKNGTQRQGKRHYGSNRYFIIKCDYSNFEEFQEEWQKVTLLSARPTWDEYSKFAMYPGVWNEAGESLIHTKDVKWRPKRKTKS